MHPTCPPLLSPSPLLRILPFSYPPLLPLLPAPLLPSPPLPSPPSGHCHDQGTCSADAENGEALFSGYSSAHLRDRARVCPGDHSRQHQADHKEKETPTKDVSPTPTYLLVHLIQCIHVCTYIHTYVHMYLRMYVGGGGYRCP